MSAPQTVQLVLALIHVRIAIRIAVHMTVAVDYCGMLSPIAPALAGKGAATAELPMPTQSSRRVRSRRARTQEQKQIVTAILSIGLLFIAANLLLQSSNDQANGTNNSKSAAHNLQNGFARRFLLSKRYVRSSNNDKPSGYGSASRGGGSTWRGSVAGVDTRPRVPNMPSGEAIERRQKMMGIETEVEKEERRRREQEQQPQQQPQKELLEEQEAVIKRQKIEIQHANTPMSDRPYLKLRAHPGGRIGNDLFSFASSYALAKAYSYNLCLMTYTDEWHRREFKLEDSFVGPFLRCDQEWENTRTTRQIGTVHTDKLGLVWDEHKMLRDITLSDRLKDLEIGGHLQRYGNFDMYLDDILERLTFKEEIQSKVEETIGSNREEGTVLVGIHARRGDMKDSELYNPGQTFYQQAIDRMRSEIEQRAISGGDNAPRIKFLVFSEGDEGRNWFESSHVEVGGIFFPLEDFEYLGSDDGMVDLAILSSCDHNIISGGTYSFWSAMLGGWNMVGRDDSAGSRIVITSNDNYGLPEGWILISGRDDTAEISPA